MATKPLSPEDPRATIARRPRRRWAAGIGVVVAAVVAIVVFVVGVDGPSRDQPPRAAGPRQLHATSGLPVYARPIADASARRSDTPEIARKNAYYSEARAITTPYGIGYVVPAPGGWTCLIVPAHPDGYGEGCASAEQIAKRALPVANTGYRGAGGVMAAVLPSTATDATLRLADGTTRSLPMTDGVITAAATGHATVTFRIGARMLHIKLYNPIRCVEGSPSLTPQEIREAADQMGVDVC
jgi:hypothetical protein